MIWLLAVVAWTALAVVVAPMVGRILAAGERRSAVVPSGRRRSLLPSPRRPLSTS